MNHEIKIGLPGLQQHELCRDLRLSESADLSVSEPAGETDFFTHPDSVQVFDYPNTTNSGVSSIHGIVNDSINAHAQAHAERRRALRSVSLVAARAGQSRHRTLCAIANHLS